MPSKTKTKTDEVRYEVLIPEISDNLEDLISRRAELEALQEEFYEEPSDLKTLDGIRQSVLAGLVEKKIESLLDQAESAVQSSITKQEETARVSQTILRIAEHFSADPLSGLVPPNTEVVVCNQLPEVGTDPKLVVHVVRTDARGISAVNIYPWNYPGWAGVPDLSTLTGLAGLIGVVSDGNTWQTGHHPAGDGIQSGSVIVRGGAVSVAGWESRKAQADRYAKEYPGDAMRGLSKDEGDALDDAGVY